MSSILSQLGTAVKNKLDLKLNKSGGTVTGDLTLNSPLKLAAYNSNNLPSAGTAMRIIYVSDLDCIAVDDGTNWRKIDLGTTL